MSEARVPLLSGGAAGPLRVLKSEPLPAAPRGLSTMALAALDATPKWAHIGREIDIKLERAS